MSTIYKYKLLKHIEDQDVMMPIGQHGRIELLHVAFQHDELCLWARVDPGYPERAVRVHVRETGHPMGEGELGAYHVGTVLSASQNLVLHVWAQRTSR